MVGVFLDGRKAQKDATLTGDYQYVAFLPGLCAVSAAGSFAKPWTFCNPDLGTPDYEWLWFETDDLVTFTYSCAKVAQKLSTTGYSSTPYILGICVNVFKAEDATSTNAKGNYNVVYQFNINNGNVGLQFKKTGPYVPKADPDPTHIDTAEKLVAFLKAATAETTTDYIMTKDVDMKGVTVPTAAGFKGTFDGKGKTIKNLAATAPLFATLDGTVKNVTLEGAFTFDPKDHKVFGALVAESNGDIEKVINKASVTATATEAEAADAYLLGGLIGKTAGKVTDCKNEGAVTLTGKALSGTMVAGVVAYASADVTDCENKGKVALNFTYTWNKADFDYIPLAKEQLVPGVGGVVGITQAAKVTGSKNYGEVVYNETAIENLTANKNRHQIGGVVAAPGGDVENCINEGAINVTSASTNRKAVVTEGTVKRENIVCVGGITGGGFHSVNQTGANIKSCNNSGAISVDTDAAQSNSAVGGIVGWLGVESTDLVAKIENCANTGNVTIKGAGKGRFAGICGGTANVVDCTNNATVTIKSTNSSSVAALGLGFHTQAHTVSGCTLEGSVVAECKIDGAGGLYGGQGNVAEEGKTYGNNVNATITTTDDTKNIGLVVGKISSGSYVVVLGTDTAPIKVKGTVNSTALTSENYVDYLFNGGASVKNKSVKAAFWN